MPTYEYVCKNCGETIEVFQAFTDKPLKKHQECGGDLQKVFHARGIVFKGSGFYVTDSKKKVGASTGSSGSEKSDSSPSSSNPSSSNSSSSNSSSSSSSSSASGDD